MIADAYLCSYAKSGRTWMRFALAHLLNDVYQLDQQFDLDNMFTLLPNDDGPGRTHPWKAIDHYQFSDITDMPLIAMSHLPWERRFLDLPVVFLVRNPADTLVSWYYHLRYHEEKIDSDLNQFIISSGTEDWIDYINSWLPHLEDNNVLLVSYEDLKREPLINFSALAAWLGINANQIQREDALRASDFTRMRKVEQDSGLGHDYNRDDPRGARVRKGQVGSWRQELSSEASDYLIERLQDNGAVWQFIQRNNINPLSL